MNKLNTDKILGFVAPSGSGKTTLIEQLIALLKNSGLSLAAIKNSHHQVEIDQPGKDSYRLRQAGAVQTMLVSPGRWALVTEMDASLSLTQAVAQLDIDKLDLIIVEGFQQDKHPKIEIHRPSLGKPLLFPHDPSIIAVATDAKLALSTELTILDLNDLMSIKEFILIKYNLCLK
jgi:molybdopterin-guanine dinucleotide biosynthesis protein MobB